MPRWICSDGRDLLDPRLRGGGCALAGGVGMRAAERAFRPIFLAEQTDGVDRLIRMGNRRHLQCDQLSVGRQARTLRIVDGPVHVLEAVGAGVGVDSDTRPGDTIRRPMATSSIPPTVGREEPTSGTISG